MSRLQGILEMPGFHGFPSKASIENNQQEVSQPVYKFRRYLTNGQMWEHKGALPYNPEFNYPEKSKFAFPQSKTSLDTGFASNPETIMFPNPDAGYKLNPEFKDAYFLAYNQREIAQKGAEEKQDINLPERKKKLGFIGSAVTGKRAEDNLNRLLKFNALQTEEAIAEYAEGVSGAVKAKLTEKLKKAGFSEEAIQKYLNKQEDEAIEAVAKSTTKLDSVSAMDVASLMDYPTATDAAGIGATSVVQNPQVQVSKVGKRNTFASLDGPRRRMIDLSKIPIASNVKTRMGEIKTLDLNV
jgi:hypothetical protein